MDEFFCVAVENLSHLSFHCSRLECARCISIFSAPQRFSTQTKPFEHNSTLVQLHWLFWKLFPESFFCCCQVGFLHWQKNYLKNFRWISVWRINQDKADWLTCGWEASCIHQRISNYQKSFWIVFGFSAIFDPFQVSVDFQTMMSANVNNSSKSGTRTIDGLSRKSGCALTVLSTGMLVFVSMLIVESVRCQRWLVLKCFWHSTRLSEIWLKPVLQNFLLASKSRTNSLCRYLSRFPALQL